MLQLEFPRFDYRGHGESSGDFLELTLTDWIHDTCQVLDRVAQSPRVILVGSSMGVWIAMHVALACPKRVVGIVGMGAAPDFTQDLFNKLSPTDKQMLQQQGVLYRASQYSDRPYPITKRLIEDGSRWMLLNDNMASIPVTCPVHLFHGKKDADVPWQRSMALAERLETLDVVVTLIKNGDHRLSEPSDLMHMISGLISMVTKAKKY